MLQWSTELKRSANDGSFSFWSFLLSAAKAEPHEVVDKNAAMADNNTESCWWKTESNRNIWDSGIRVFESREYTLKQDICDKVCDHVEDDVVSTIGNHRLLLAASTASTLLFSWLFDRSDVLLNSNIIDMVNLLDNEQGLPKISLESFKVSDRDAAKVHCLSEHFFRELKEELTVAALFLLSRLVEICRAGLELGKLSSPQHSAGFIVKLAMALTLNARANTEARQYRVMAKIGFDVSIENLLVNSTEKGNDEAVIKSVRLLLALAESGWRSGGRTSVGLGVTNSCFK